MTTTPISASIRAAVTVVVLLGGGVPSIDAVDWPDAALPPPLTALPGGPAELEPTRGVASAFEDQVMELVNQERWNNGQLAPLKRVDLLDSSSETHSSNMATRNFHMHCDPDTLTMPADRMADVGYVASSSAENIAAGYTTPDVVMTAWMGSSGHRANILTTSRREIGIGYVYQSGDQNNVRQSTNGLCPATSSTNGPYFHYWTQNFGTRSAVYPVVINREAMETPTADVDLYLYGGDWATEMRIRNESGTFTAWLPFAANVDWQLTPGPGNREVFVEIRSGATVRSASDTIISTDAGDLIFEDGFESGNTTAWDATQP